MRRLTSSDPTVKAQFDDLRWFLLKLARYLIIYQQYSHCQTILSTLHQLKGPTLESALLLSLCLTKMDLPDHKTKKLLRFLSLFPNEPVLLHELALTYELFDQNQKSIDLYMKALKINKYSQESLNQVAGQVFYLGSPELSIMLYKKLLGTRPTGAN